MAKPRTPLSAERVRLVHVARRALALEEDDYRSLLRRVGGVESARELDEKGFGLVMDAFARLGFQSTSNRRHLGRRERMASAGHIATIRALWGRYTEEAGTEAELNRWLERTWHISALRFLPLEVAPKVIIALRAMCARRGLKGGGRAA